MTNINSKPLILICGPTGVGKSNLAVSLCHKINGEIISADSVQVYKGLDIGSAKVTDEEKQGITHYLIDCLNPDEDFAVNIFQQMAKDAIDEIYSKGKIPVIVGGTAFYIQALLYDINFTEEEENEHEYRDFLLNSASTEEGAVKLWNQLNTIDPDYAQITHYNNVKRVARALEYNHNTGRLFSEYNKEQSEKESDYNFIYVGLIDERKKLYDRINKRVDTMINNGLVNEVKTLRDMGYSSALNSLSSIGYKEIGEYLDGHITLEDAIEDIKKNSRHYAKRQLTWLRRERNVTFYNRSDYSEDIEIIESIIDNAKHNNILCDSLEV